MRTTPTDEMLDMAEVERLGTAFNRCFETLEADREAIAPDVFCDLLPPMWRFQLQGADAFTDQLRAIGSEGQRATLLRLVPTATGFVMEHEEETPGPPRERARRLWLCEVRDGRITEVVGYCNGGWDDELRARHAAEAPMLRPWGGPDA
jgi:hypothetical protein